MHIKFELENLKGRGSLGRPRHGSDNRVSPLLNYLRIGYIGRLF
jgi:hypothetical protein